MKLTIIGNNGPYATKKGSATSCYLVEDNDTKIVLDFGSGALANLLGKVKIEEIDAIFISHLHYDHTSDLLTLRYLLDKLNHDITIITAYDGSEWYEILFGSDRFNVINISEDSRLKIKGLELSFFETEHPVRNFGIRIVGSKVLTYTGDTTYYHGIEENLLFSDAVLIDAGKPDSFNGPHAKFSEAVKLQAELGGKYYVTHFDEYIPTSTDDNVVITELMAEYEV